MSSVPPKVLTIQFFDVGQGDGMYILFPNNETMLVDLGSTKGKRITGPDILTYFKNHTKFSQKGQTLDYLILTHGDIDHYNMVGATLAALEAKVGNIMYGGLKSDYLYRQSNIIDVVKAANPDLLTLKPTGVYPAWIYDSNGAEVRVFAWNTPPTLRSDEAWRKNTASIVLQVVYGGISVLLTGDATTDTEKEIIRCLSAQNLLANLGSDVLKLGHHGSHRTSNSADWLTKTNPEYVFVSADRSGSLPEQGKKTGHRHPQYITLDLLQRYASSLAKNCAPHSWVSSYDPEDYGEYNDSPDDPPGDALPAPKDMMTCSWVETTGTAGIFSTLSLMDVKQPNQSEFDQGVQYELAIKQTGEVNIYSTLEDDSPAQAVVPAPKQ